MTRATDRANWTATICALINWLDLLTGFTVKGFIFRAEIDSINMINVNARQNFMTTNITAEEDLGEGLRIWKTTSRSEVNEKLVL